MGVLRRLKHVKKTNSPLVLGTCIPYLGGRKVPVQRMLEGTGDVLATVRVLKRVCSSDQVGKTLFPNKLLFQKLLGKAFTVKDTAR